MADQPHFDHWKNFPGLTIIALKFDEDPCRRGRAGAKTLLAMLATGNGTAAILEWQVDLIFTIVNILKTTQVSLAVFVDNYLCITKICKIPEQEVPWWPYWIDGSAPF